MARLVKRTASAPMKIEIGGETKWICACGLSKSQPFCDGTHNRTAKLEDGGRLYWYDEDGNRHESDRTYDAMRSW